MHSCRPSHCLFRFSFLFVCGFGNDPPPPHTPPNTHLQRTPDLLSLEVFLATRAVRRERRASARLESMHYVSVGRPRRPSVSTPFAMKLFICCRFCLYCCCCVLAVVVFLFWLLFLSVCLPVSLFLSLSLLPSLSLCASSLSLCFLPPSLFPPPPPLFLKSCYCPEMTLCGQ